MRNTALDGRTAIVTGASSGIGRTTVHALAEEGADVVLAARREERLTEVADRVEAEHEVETLVVPTDVTDREQVDALIEQTAEAFDGIDVVVNNAGLGRGEGVEDLTDEEYRQMMEVNCDGMFYLARASLSHLRESNGNLIFLGSFAGKYPRPSNPVYAATKWWTRGFAHSVEARAGDDGVAVTVVNPTEVRTEFGSEEGEAFEERFEPGEITEPEEIAEAIRFAAKQDNSTVSELDLYRRDKFSHF